MKKQLLAISAGRVLGTALQAVTIVMVARATPVDRFGLLSAVLGTVTVLTSLGDFGITTLLARARATGFAELQKGCVRINRVLTLLLSVSLCLAAVLVTGSSRDAVAFGALAIALCLEKNTECLLSVPVADGRWLVPSLSLLARRTATLATTVVLGVVNFGDWLFAFGVGMLVGAVLGQVQISIVVRRQLIETPGQPQQAQLVLRAAAPFFVSNFSAQSRMLDVSLVAITAGPAAAGLYGAANRIVQPFTLVPNVLSTVLLPKASRSTKLECRAMVSVLSRATLILLLLMGVAALYARDLVFFVLGSAYQESSNVLAALLLALPFISLAPAFGSLLQAHGQERFVGWNGFVFAVFTLAGASLGSLLAGAAGGAIGVGLAYAIKCFSLQVRLSRVLRETGPASTVQKSEQPIGNGDPS